MGSNTLNEAESRRSWAPTACLVGVCVGIVSMLVGALWKSTTTPATFWSADQAAEFAAAHDAYHASLHDHGGAGAAAHEGESPGGDLAEAKARFERIDAELKDAQFARDRVGPLLMQIGLAAAIAFGVGYLISGRSE